MMLCPGQVYETSVTVHGGGTQPGTATLTITKPDGTQIQQTGPWTWAQSGTDWTTSYDYTLPTAGPYKFAWVTTSPGTAPPPVYENVRDFISVVSLREMKEHLTSGDISSWTGDDTELMRFMQGATEMIESKAGYCVRRAVTERVADGGAQLVLARLPVLSVESVTSTWAGGPGWVTADLLVDGEAGIVSLKIPLLAFWYPPWDVAYTVGRLVTPEHLIHAAKEQVKHMWETQRGRTPLSVPMGGEETFTTQAGWAFSIPNRVLELLADDAVPSI